MQELTKLQQVFENDGQSLTGYLWKNQPVWIARDLGRFMGYRDQGRGLVDQIRQDWINDLIEDTDYRLLQDQELAEFKKCAAGNTGSVIFHHDEEAIGRDYAHTLPN